MIVDSDGNVFENRRKRKTDRRDYENEEENLKHPERRIKDRRDPNNQQAKPRRV